MINFIPIFPLNIVVYPGEQLNLHIFEERYKQLINESFKTQKPFGIPSVFNNNVSEIGTLAKVTEIVQVYDDGKMEIRTEGISVFRVLEIIKKVPDKLYSGAIVD
jgi:Lon protease-like protein